MKLSKSKIVSLIGVLGLLAAGGCSDPNVTVIKEGYFNRHKDVSIGAIMQARFDNCKWSSGIESGRTVVTFTGKISKATHDLAMKLHEKDEWHCTKLFVETLDLNHYPEISQAYQQKLKQMNYPKKKAELKKLREEAGRIRWDNTDYSGASVEDLKKVIESDEKEMKGLKVLLKDQSKKYRTIDVKDQIERLKYSIERNKKLLPIAIQYQKFNDPANALDESLEKMKYSAMNEIFEQLFWAPGSETTFKWVIYPDGKTFELVAGSNGSWKKFKFPLDFVLTYLFSK